MAYKCFFMSNKTYSASDVNQMFARLTSQGVSLFDVSGNGTLIDINTAVSNFTGAGVELYNPDACKVVSEGEGYKVSPGCLWLPDGMCVEIDSDGYDLTVENGKTQYIYVESQPVTNSAAVVVSDTEGGADSVPLAEISADGEIADTRTFAKTKLAPATANISVEKTISITLTGSAPSQYEEIGFSGFSFLFYFSPVSKRDKITDLSDGESHTIALSSISGRNISVQKQGSGLVFTRDNYNYSDYPFTFTVV